jgi:hypothetical protein
VRLAAYALADISKTNTAVPISSGSLGSGCGDTGVITRDYPGRYLERNEVSEAEKKR